MANKKGIVPLCGVIGMLCWGLSYIWSLSVFKYLTPMTTIFFRLIISVFTLFLCGKIFHLSETVHRDDWVLFALASLFEPFLYFIFESYGLVYSTSPVISAGIIAMIPLFGTLAAFIFLKEKMSRWNIFGFIFSFFGVIVMLIGKDMKLTAEPKGIFFLSLAVITAVFYTLSLSKLTKKYNPVTVVYTQNIIGIFYFLPLVLINEMGFLKPFISPSTDLFAVEKYIIPLLCLGIFASSVAYTAWALLFQKLGAARANVYSNIIPVFTAFFSFLFFGEEITIGKIVGVFMVIGGLILSQTKIHIHLHRKIDDR